jgi:hypothetical protein
MARNKKKKLWIESFSVTFAYQYWVSDTTNSSGLGLGLSTPVGILRI